MLTARELDEPNPNCFVCQTTTLPLTLDCEKFTLKELLERVIKKDLALAEPTILIDGDIVWEEGEGAEMDDFAVNLNKPLVKLPGGGIKNGGIFCVQDFSQDITIDISVTHCDTWELEEGEDEETDNTFKFILSGKKPVAKTEDTKPAAAENKPNEDADTVVVMSSNKRDAGEVVVDDKQPLAKKMKANSNEDEVVVVD